MKVTATTIKVLKVRGNNVYNQLKYGTVENGKGRKSMG